MRESGQVERAARRGIARAKDRADEMVTPDDLLVGALSEISRFGVAWIGNWAVDVRALSEKSPEQGDVPSRATERDAQVPAPAYAPGTVELLDRGAALAREDGAASLGLVHLLAAFVDVECALMTELRREYGFSDVQWRGELARGVIGAPPHVTEIAGNGGVARTPGGPEILGVEDAAEYLGVHSQTVRNYIRSGKLPAYRLAGERYLRVLRKDLLTLLEQVPTEGSDEDEETP